MISHQYKCIFIHIPRTAGSSIEHWICGQDWWEIDKETKHLFASQAKQLYAPYWDSYFKFAFVRNPWDRMVSCLKYKGFFGIIEKNGQLDFRPYKKRFGYPLTLENDYRFSDRKAIKSKKHRWNCVYLNMLDESLDFIGKFENLQEDTTFIQEQLGIEKPFPIQQPIEHSERSSYVNYYNARSKKTVARLFKKDIKHFNYTFG